MQFVNHHNCRKDKICSRICTNCCKVFNVATNEEVDKIKRIKLKKDISQKEIEETARKIKLLTSDGKDEVIKEPFIIIKPCGMNLKERILRFLKSKNVVIKYRKIFDNWHDLAKAIYCYPLTKEKIIFTLESSKAFQMLEGDRVEVLYLNKISLDELRRIKYELRKLFPDKRRLLVVGDKRRIIRSTVLHSPDEKDMERELIILNNFLKQN